MINKTPPFPLNSRVALISLLIVATPMAFADTDKKPVVNSKNLSGKKEVAKTQSADSKLTLDEMVVTTSDNVNSPLPTPSKTNISAPSTKVRKADIDKTNAVTTADSVKYESGIFARQRYIGDPNAPVGMRGSSAYQGGRVLVYMDGISIMNAILS